MQVAKHLSDHYQITPSHGIEVGGIAVGPFETSSGQYIRRVLRTRLDWQFDW